jgi:hypothetical protein
MAFILVENVGRTPAIELSLSARPQFKTSGRGRPSADDASDPAMIALRYIFDGTPRISMLAPGEELRYVLDFAKEMLDHDNGIPSRYDVRAEYRAPGGKRRFSGQFVLDIEPWRYSVMEADVMDVIARQTRRISEHLGEIRKQKRS